MGNTLNVKDVMMTVAVMLKRKWAKMTMMIAMVVVVMMRMTTMMILILILMPNSN